MDPQLPLHAMVLDHWSAEQGLPQITVLAVTQDRAGFLWITTQTALARFDGEAFATFDRATTGVDTSMLEAAWADPSGQVWFGGPQGVLRYGGGHFTGLGGSPVNAIVDSGDGTPLLATATGLARVRDGRVVPLPGYRGPALSLLRVGDTLWIGGVGRVCRLDSKNLAAAPVCVAQDGRATAITHLAHSAEGLWLGTQAGLKRLDGEHIIAAGLGQGLDTTRIESLLVDHAGSLWVGTAPALFRHLAAGGLERIADDAIADKPWVQALFEDSAGNLWMGTHTRGLYRVWNGWTRRVSSVDGLSDALVWSVLGDGHGNVLIGTNSGVDVFDGEHVRPLLPGSALTDPSAYELARDSRGRLWVGTRAGVSVFEGGRRVTPPALAQLDRWQINDVREIAADDIWIGTSRGLFRWYAGALTRLDPGTSGPAATVRVIHVAGPDRVYVGTGDGVQEWRGGRMTQPAWAAPLRGRFVTRIANLGPGLLGIGTNDAGIGVMRGGQLRMTGRKQGLPSDNVWTMDVIGGDLYVGSNAGAWRMSLARLPMPGSAQSQVRPQLVAGELRATSVHNSPCCNGGGGSRSLVVGDAIWFATTDGALRVDTRRLGTPKPPPARIDSIEHAGRQYPDASFDLHAGARDIAIHYTAPYLGMGAVSFRYQLEGYDTQWQDAGSRRTVFYTHLPPGNFRFRVMATVAGSDGYGPQATLSINVLPRWYERSLVRTAAVLLALLALYLLLGWRARRVRRQNLRLEAQVAQRTEQLAEVVERLRTTNLALAEASQTDQLTALHNRRYLLSCVPDILSGGGSVGVLQIDLDYFKRVNDSYGHAVGDEVLRSVGRLLAAARRESDITSRWGGEEFLLLLCQVDAAGVLNIAERLRQDIAAHTFADGRGGSIHLTCSIGFSLHPLSTRGGSDAFDAVLELADVALYQAKADGRNACVGLVATHDLSAAALQSPFAPQLQALLASGRLTWLRPRP
ncbi:MAG: diguanylate cyclase [Rhodanobacter sp.]